MIHIDKQANPPKPFAICNVLTEFRLIVVDLPFMAQ